MYTENYKAISRNGKVLPVQGEWYHVWIHKIVEMMNRGDSPTIAFVGDTNTGKSMKALRTCEILYEELDVFQGSWEAEQNLVYEVLPFLQEIHDIPTPDHDETINEEREAFIFDEGGVNLNAKDNRQAENRGVDEVLQTMRIKNCLYMFVTPSLRDLDKSIRKDVDFIISVQDQGVAGVLSVKQNRDALEARFETFVDKWGYWFPDMPREEYIKDYREKEYPHKEKFVGDRIEQLEKKEREEEIEAAEGIL